MRRYTLLIGGLFAALCLIPRGVLSQENQRWQHVESRNEPALDQDQRRPPAEEELELVERPRIGIRAGATLDPDQFHLGVHIKTLEIAPHFRGQPNVELGFGSGFTVLSFNPELIYSFEIDNPVQPYAGWGVGFSIADNRNVNKSSFQVGINVLGGIEIPVSKRRSLLSEVKFGLGDIPDVKLTFGMTF